MGEKNLKWRSKYILYSEFEPDQYTILRPYTLNWDLDRQAVALLVFYIYITCYTCI